MAALEIAGRHAGLTTQELSDGRNQGKAGWPYFGWNSATGSCSNDAGHVAVLRDQFSSRFLRTSLQRPRNASILLLFLVPRRAKRMGGIVPACPRKHRKPG